MSPLNTILPTTTITILMISRQMISSIRTQTTHVLAQNLGHFNANQLKATRTSWMTFAPVSHMSTNI